MSRSNVIDIEEFKGSRIRAARFHTIAQVDRVVEIDINGTFPPAAARRLAQHILDRADAAEHEKA